MREDSSILTEAAKELARQEGEPDFTVEGLITVISEPTDRFNGTAVLETILAGAVRKVRIDFSADDRTTIFEAAQGKRWVRGSVISIGRASASRSSTREIYRSSRPKTLALRRRIGPDMGRGGGGHPKRAV
jgi:hypothetical protein